MCFQHFPYHRAQAEVGKADYPGGYFGLLLLVLAGHLLYKFGLSDGSECSGPVAAVIFITFGIDGLGDIVSSAKILQQFLDQIDAGGELPQVMMRVANGQLRLQDCFRGAISIDRCNTFSKLLCW